MPQPLLTDPPPEELPLDPAYDELTPTEQAQSWWRGSDDEQAVRDGDDVEWASDEHFPSGLGRSRLGDEQWARVAYYVAAGISITEIAKYFGVSRTTIWRGMQRSSGLRHRVTQERRMFQRETDSRFVALRHAVVDGLQHAICAGNIRVLLWAADRLDLGGTILPKEERSPRPRPTLRRHPAPPAVREMMAAAEQATIVQPAPPPAPLPPAPILPVAAEAPAPVTTPPADDPPPVLPVDNPPLAAGPRPATGPTAAPPAADTNDTTDDAPAPPPPPVIILAPRRARDMVRRLPGRMRPIPELADGIDWKETETMQFNSQGHGLPRLICTAAEPLNPYRPLRHYRWP